jgi:hypothetical protein
MAASAGIVAGDGAAGATAIGGLLVIAAAVGAVGTAAGGAAGVDVPGVLGTVGPARFCTANGSATGAGGVAGGAAPGAGSVPTVEGGGDIGDDVGAGGDVGCGGEAAAVVAGGGAAATDGAAGVGAGGAGAGVAAGAAAVDDGAVGLAALLVSGGADPTSEYPRLPISKTPIARAANSPITHPVFHHDIIPFCRRGIVITREPKAE